jgi:hypothetical protein
VGFWLALVVYVVAVAGGIAYVVLRGLALWRKLKRTGGAFGAETARIADQTALMEGHFDRMNSSVADLGEASRRLSASRARLGVQLQAVREARETMRRLLWFIPGA